LFDCEIQTLSIRKDCPSHDENDKSCINLIEKVHIAWRAGYRSSPPGQFPKYQTGFIFSQENSFKKISILKNLSLGNGKELRKLGRYFLSSIPHWETFSSLANMPCPVVLPFSTHRVCRRHDQPCVPMESLHECFRIHLRLSLDFVRSDALPKTVFGLQLNNRNLQWVPSTWSAWIYESVFLLTIIKCIKDDDLFLFDSPVCEVDGVKENCYHI